MQLILERTSRLFHSLGMMPRRARLLVLFGAFLLSYLVYSLFAAALTTVEERFGALGWTLAAEQVPEQRLVIVAIDEKSIAEVGAWPWPREVMASLVEALNDYNVQLQLHDIVYSEPSVGDDALIAALESSRGAVIAQVPALQTSQQVTTGVLTHPVTGVNCASGLPGTNSFIAPHSGYSRIPKGHISPVISPDGAVREVPALVCVEGEAFPALALSALLQMISSDDWAVTLNGSTSWFSPTQTLEIDGYPGLSVPLDRDGNMRISFRNAPESFTAVSAVDVINGVIDPQMLQNSWVLVGATAFGIGDIVPTPFNGAAPGVELQARMMVSLLDATIPFTPSGAPLLLLGFSLVAAAVFYLLASARENVSAYGLPLAGLLLPVAAFWFHAQLLHSLNIWLGWMYPTVFCILAASLLLLLEQGKLRSERSRVYSNLNSYLPGDVAREIAYSLPSSSINAKRRDVTLLSADLRNFAAFGEARPPEESAAILHFFFVRATEIVEKFGGRVQEFKGDGLLAVWDRQDSESARSALKTAQEMQEVIEPCLSSQNLPAWLAPLALGIGIEQGPALIGSIGPANRRTHTLLGDTVTITLRIQEMSAELAQPILIGECAARQLSEFALVSQGSYLLSGLRIPHLLFALPSMKTSPRKKHSQGRRLKIIKGGRG